MDTQKIKKNSTPFKNIFIDKKTHKAYCFKVNMALGNNLFYIACYKNLSCAIYDHNLIIEQYKLKKEPIIITDEEADKLQVELLLKRSMY